jgi:hypothetical protein
MQFSFDNEFWANNKGHIRKGIDLADKALYLAEHRRRNRVVNHERSEKMKRENKKYGMINNVCTNNYSIKWSKRHEKRILLYHRYGTSVQFHGNCPESGS